MTSPLIPTQESFQGQESFHQSGKIYGECRICFSEDPLNDLMKNPCACKGSMSFVHEQCLKTWLQSKGTRNCELCKTRYKIKEELLALSQIFEKGVLYLQQDKTRILKIGLYFLYMYVFSRRALQLSQYFFRLTYETTAQFFKLLAKIISKGKLKFANPINFSLHIETSVTSKFVVLLKFWKVLKFLYRFFLFTQILVIAYGEYKRLRKTWWLVRRSLMQVKIIQK